MMSLASTAIGLGLFLVGIALIVGYFKLQAKSLREWTGVFFALACAPIVVWVVWLAMLLRDFAADPTSHNLFPFEMAFIAVAGFAFLVVVAGIRMAVGSLAQRG